MATRDDQPLLSVNNQQNYATITDYTDPIAKEWKWWWMSLIGRLILLIWFSCGLAWNSTFTLPPCNYMKEGVSCDWKLNSYSYWNVEPPINHILVIIFIIFVVTMLLINNICWIKQKNMRKNPLSPKYYLFISINIISLFTIYFSIFNDNLVSLLLCPLSMCCFLMFTLYGGCQLNETLNQRYRLVIRAMIFFIVILIIFHCWYVFDKIYDANTLKYRTYIICILNLTISSIVILCTIIGIIIFCKNRKKSRTESIQDETTDITMPVKRKIPDDVGQYIDDIYYASGLYAVGALFCSLIILTQSISWILMQENIYYGSSARFQACYIYLPFLFYWMYRRPVARIDDYDAVGSWKCPYCEEQKELEEEQCIICAFKREIVSVADEKQNELEEKLECNCIDGEMDLTECNPWMRIKRISEQFINNKPEDLDKHVYDIYGSITSLLDDYHHIILKHDIKDINQCDITKCECTNYIDRDDRNSNNKKFKSLLLSIMKEIHCFIYHNINRHSQKRRCVIIITSSSDNIDQEKEEKLADEEEEKVIKSQQQKPEQVEEKQREEDELGTYGYGVFMEYTKFQSQFDSLKEEMLNNKIFPIKPSDWQKIYDASLQLIKTAEGRASGLSIGQMLAIKMYTDLTSECTYFRNSYRPNKEHQSNDDVALEHCLNFYHWGKHLQSAIYQHGHKLMNEKKYYHGLTEPFTFSSLRKDFNIPTSLTTNLTQAQIFAALDGIVLQLISGWNDQYENKTKLFPVQWISKFPDEEESLLFGNHNKLIIYDIIPQNKLNINPHKKYIKAIYNFEVLCDGEIHDDHTEYLYDLIELIQNKLNRDNQNSYIAQLFSNICKKKQYFAVDSITQNIEISSAFENVECKEINIDSLECCDRNCGKTLIQASKLKNKYKCYGCEQDADIVCHGVLIGCEYALCLKCSKIVSFLNKILIKAKHKKKSMLKDEHSYQKEQQEREYETRLEDEKNKKKQILSQMRWRNEYEKMSLF